MAKDAPLYAKKRAVTLRPIPKDSEIWTSKYPYKISFSFADDQLLTPWITVTDGTGQLLRSIYFTFIYSGVHITQVKYVTEYKDVTGLIGGDKDEDIAIPEVVLRYRWEEEQTISPESGFSLLLILSFTTSIVFIITVCLKYYHLINLSLSFLQFLQ